MKNKDFLDFLIKIHSVAKIGLLYSSDPYALANYQELNDLSKEMIEKFTSIKIDRSSYFERDVYPTPNISVRTIVFNPKREILLVQEAKDGLFSLPGGWCDLYESPMESAAKECLQEAGANVEITRLVGLRNRTPLKGPTGVPEYVAVFEGKLIGELGSHEHETISAGFYPLDHLPQFSHKVRIEEILTMIQAVLDGKTIFD